MQLNNVNQEIAEIKENHEKSIQALNQELIYQVADTYSLKQQKL